MASQTNVKCRSQTKYKNIFKGFKVSIAEDGLRGLAKDWAPPAIGYSLQGLGKLGFNDINHLPQPIFNHSTTQKNGNKLKPSSHQQRAQKQYITPEHNEMIKYVQQTWKGVEEDYKKSANKFINNLDLNNSLDHHNTAHMKQKQGNTKKKTATTSTPLLLSGSYHHTSTTKDSSNSRQDSFQPFDLEAFWGNRILKRLTEEI